MTLKMIWVRKLFGILLLAVAAILVASIVVTVSQAVAYFSLMYLCITEGCEGDALKNILLGIVTYLFMAFMVYYLGRRGFLMLVAVKPEEPEPIAILDEADFSHTQEDINYFQTKYGYCHVLPDRIIFANTKMLEEVSAYKEGNKVFGMLAVQFTIICAMLYYIFTEEFNFWKLLAPALIVIVFGFSLVTSLRNSTTAIILREKIISVNFVKGIPYLITPHYIIWFRDNKTRKRKRLVILADISEKNISEALRIFRKASLIDELPSF